MRIRQLARCTLWCAALLLLVPDARAGEGLRWRLDPLEDGRIRWLGELPENAARQGVRWRARAVWTSDRDGTTTALLAQTDWIFSEYRQDHLVPLSTLAPAPDAGEVALRLEASPGGTIEAAAWLPGHTPSDGDAWRAIELLRGEIVTASRYGVPTDDARALVACIEFANRAPKPNRGRGGADRNWEIEACGRMVERLRGLRDHPEEWRRVPIVPLDRVETKGDGGNYVTMQVGERVVETRVSLVAPPFTVEADELDLVAAMGFNCIDWSGPSGTLTEVARRVRQLNLAPVMAATRPDVVAGRADGTIERRHSALTSKDLWLLSREAMAVRRGEPQPDRETPPAEVDREPYQVRYLEP